jgi:Bacterial PH domain
MSGASVPSSTTFRLAPMTWDLVVLTVLLLPLPAVLFGIGVAVSHQPGVQAAPASVVLRAVGGFLALMYVWVWLWFRPTHFLVLPHALEIVWPVRHRWLPRNTITAVRVLDRKELRALVGTGLRVGSGGLWGGFGWLWTTKRGMVRMYISRTDRFVWIERGEDQPWLVTPERPEEFVRALGS